ncbi:MAG: VapC toxin family PIN domain ribonuclease [Verrucomicrobia bacterium]|nr:VapC toxin family PIN domain ribonuclease [Verrucomicrobiota bacterium]
MYLLDINVLLALCDEAHEFHEAAWVWFAPRRAAGWATCPLTENGFLRILGHPAHPARLGSLGAAREILAGLCQGQGHRFWPDEVSILDRTQFPELAAVTSKALTDLYLVGLAALKKARFATFDRRVNASVVTGGPQALEVISV